MITLNNANTIYFIKKNTPLKKLINYYKNTIFCFKSNIKILNITFPQSIAFC